jgi:hypothetical protein
MACLIRWMDWSLTGVFGSQSSLVSGILSSAIAPDLQAAVELG